MKKILIILFLLSFLIRALLVLNNSISFHYDMSRDAFAIQEIWADHNLKIQGPPTSYKGLNHGVFYYYLLAPFYYLGNGNPQIPAIFLAFLNSLPIIPLYFLAKEYFKQKKWIICSLLIFIFSYESIQYAVWLSNPAPSLLTLACFFYGLKLWEKKDEKGLPLAIISAAFSIQFQFFFFYLFAVIIFFKIIFKTQIHFKHLFLSSLAALIIISSYLIALLKFNKLNESVLFFFNILGGDRITEEISFTYLAGNYLNHFASLFTNNFFPMSLFFGGIFGILVVLVNRKEKFLLFCLFSNLIIYIFGGHSSNYGTVGLVIPAILLVILTIKQIEEKKLIRSFLLVSIILASNLIVLVKNKDYGQKDLVIPRGMILSEQLKLVDKTYEIAKGQKFSINSLSLPLWTNTTWSYLYQWYGLKTYGYLPTFYGRDQAGMPGGFSLNPGKPESLSFFIVEPKDGIADKYWQSEFEKEDSQTELIKEYKFKELKLEERKPKK